MATLFAGSLSLAFLCPLSFGHFWLASLHSNSPKQSGNFVLNVAHNSLEFSVFKVGTARSIQKSPKRVHSQYDPKNE